VKKIYNKLIRDRIPEIIRSDGKQFDFKIMSENEYRQALLEKLVEEAQEAAQSCDDNLPIELADLYEVIDAVMAAWKIRQKEVKGIQAKRREQRGGFERRIKLLWTE